MNYSLGNMLGGAGALNADKLALNLQFATDKTLTARKGPTPVFTRASGATQVGASGLIEFAPENLLLHSENFKNTTSSSYWENQTTTSVTVDQTTSPDGGNNADLLVTSTTSFDCYARRAIGYTGSTQYTYSVFLKQGPSSHRYVGLYIGVGISALQFPFFDFNNPTVVQIPSGTMIGTIDSTSVEAYPNGWYRVSVTFTPAATPVTNYVGVYISTSNGTLSSSNPAGLNTYIWGAQLERSSLARAYIPTTTAAVYTARFDHDPITLACKGLLIEESRTNLITNSGNALLWPSTGTDEGSLTAPDGSSNGKLVGVGTAGITTSSVSATAIAYSFSVFVKRNNTDWFRLQLNHAINTNAANAWFNLATGSTGSVSVGIGSFASLSSAIVPLGNEWYRCIIIGTPPSSGSLTGSIISATGDSSVTRVTGSKYGIWGGQIEAGAFPTSYIPTTTASVVRSADICSISGSAFSSMYNQPEGTLYLDAAPPSQSFLSYPLIVSTTSINQAHWISRSNEFGVGSKRWRAWTTNAGIEATISTSSDITTTNVKTAYAYKLNDNAFAVNNVLVGTDTVVTMPNPTTMRIGGNDGATALNGHIAAVRYFRKRLANAKLQTITA